MNKLYSVILREFENNFLALCLENGVTAEGKSKEEALISLNDAIESLESALLEDENISTAPIAIKELHEFLTYQGKFESSFELKPIYA